jgi:hypothetical protein
MTEDTHLEQLKPVMPLATPEEVEKAWAVYEAMKARLLTADDYQAIAGKNYIKRSGFRKIAVFFGLSDRILVEQRVDRPDGSFTWRIIVEAKAPNGRISVGVGVCDSAERKFSHLEHDVLATAHTRAKSRAISDMVAGGAVSAEEMEAAREPEPAKELSVTETLTRAGVDPRLVEIRFEQDKRFVYPTSGLVDWPAATVALKVAGFDWDPQAKRWVQGGGVKIVSEQQPKV